MKYDDYNSIIIGWSGMPLFDAPASQQEAEPAQEVTESKKQDYHARFEMIEANRIKPHLRQYRNFSKEVIEHIVTNIKENGIYKNIIVANDSTVLVGHGIAQACLTLGYKEIPVTRIDAGPSDLRSLKLLISDNDFEHIIDIDDRALTELLKEILAIDENGLLGTGYDAQKLAALTFVTRPKSEIKDVNEAAEWVGMPNYNPDEYANPIKITVNLRDEADREVFFGLLGIDASENTHSVWWPPKETDDVASVKFLPQRRIVPRYPIYVISKGRADACLTANFLIEDEVPFMLVVEPQEFDMYAAKYGSDRIHTLPFSNLGQGSIPARNWVWEHAAKSGAERHWILDDNIKGTRKWYGGKRLACHSGTALSICEDFVDRYENIAVAGLNYTMFAHQSGRQPKDPFWLNVHVYSCLLILNSLENRWRGRYNEDTDLCLQVLSEGWCTVSFNAYMCDKVRTMTMKGGNTQDLYLDDGRLKMARSLEKNWPGVVETKRKFERPQHAIKDAWKGFDTPLKLKEGLDYTDSWWCDDGLVLKQIGTEVKSEYLKKLLEEHRQDKLF